MATIPKPRVIKLDEHENVQTMRAAFAAFEAADLDAVRASMTDDCVWTNNGYEGQPTVGTFRGWDQIVAMFGELLTLTGGTQHNEVVKVFGDDDYVVAIYDTTATVNSRTQTHRWVMLAKQRKGQACEISNSPVDIAAAHAFLTG